MLWVRIPLKADNFKLTAEVKDLFGPTSILLKYCGEQKFREKMESENVKNYIILRGKLALIAIENLRTLSV